MIKYTKKQQKFISDYYSYDLDRFVARVDNLAESCEGYESYLETFEKIFQHSRELISANILNAESLFKLVENIQEQLQNKCDLFVEGAKSCDLPREKESELGILEDVVDSLRILNNLHPERILTWEEVNQGFI